MFISVCEINGKLSPGMNLRLLLSFKLLMNCTFLQVTTIYIGSDRKWGSVLPMAFVSVPPFFCNIVYNLSNFAFIQNGMQDYLYIVMIIKQLN